MRSDALSILESAARAIPRLISPWLDLRLVFRLGLIRDKVWSLEDFGDEEELGDDADEDAQL
jgi:hypothetical protein